MANLAEARERMVEQQIAGRGLRLYPGKTDCLLVDYAGSGFNLFHPEVGERRPAASVVVTVPCPACNHANTFWGITDADGNVVEHYGRRCQALVTTTAGENQCNYRFRFKECSACGAECDIAARTCGQCSRQLVDPDEQLKAALRLKDALVLRVAGMTVGFAEQTARVTYYDEDGTQVSEFFDFGHAGQRAVFGHIFKRRLPSQKAAALDSPQAVLAAAKALKHPDFVVARKVKHHWRVQARFFDYEGRYRKANEL